MFTDLRHRVLSLIFWNRRSRELREELETHIHMEIEHNQALGMDPGEASRRAHIKLGGVERTRAQVGEASGAAVLHDVVADVAHAVRGFRRRPTYWMALFLTVSIGLSLTTTVFSFADAYLLRPLPYPQGSRLVALYDVPTPGERGSASFDELIAWREDLRQVSPIVAYLGTSAAWTDGASVQRLHLMMASRGYLSLLGIPLVAGRGLEDTDQAEGAAPVAVISEAFWRAHFGSSPGALGASLTLDGKSYTIVGVAREGHDIADSVVDAWLPLEASDEWRIPGAHFLPVIGRLAAGATLAGARSEARAHKNGDGSSEPVVIEPLREALAGLAAGPLRLLLVGALCLLFVALSNAGGLVYARSEARRADFAMRRALGASGARLVRQAATEFLVVGAAAAVFSAGIAAVGTAWVRSTWSQRYENILDAGIDLRAAALLGILLVVAAVVMAVPVVWQIRRAGTSVSSGASRVVGPRRRLWVGLVGVQVTLTTVLLVGGGLSGRSLQRLLHVDPGYDPRDVYGTLVALPRDIYRTPVRQIEAFNQLLQSLEASPEVEAAGGAVNLPLSGGTMTSTFDIEDDARSSEDQEHTMAEQHIITPGYLRAMGMRLVAGRDFTTADRSGATRVVLINETMARRYWPGENALGHRLRIVGSGLQTIVGVVADTRLDGLDHPSRLETYTPFAQAPVPYMSAVLRTKGGLGKAREAFASAEGDLDSHIPVEPVRPVQALLDHSTQGRRLPAASFGAFSLLALLLAAVGLFGLQAYAVTQRRTEIGVRMALGATRLSILRMIGGSSLYVVGTGVLVGLALAAALSRLAASYVFGITVWDGATYLGVVIVLLLTAIAATALPALRAVRVDPVVALKSE